MYIHKHLSANNISIEEFPFARELSMEAYLLENESVLSLESAGFDDVTIVESEASLLQGGKVKNGRIDILAKYGQEYIAVVELKMGKLVDKHLQQLEKYLANKDQILKKFKNIWDNEVSGSPKWIGVMVGEKIDPDLMSKIRKGYYFKNEIPIAALTINRYRGNDGNVYVVSDTYFIDKVKNKDYTKYNFKGDIYGKGRLVLAVLKDYVESKPKVKYSQLKKVFPNSLGGTSKGSNVFITEKEAIEIYQKNRENPHARHFINPDEIIQLVDGAIAVSNQWGKGNIERFINYCNNVLKIKIKVLPNIK
jgi:hypothetical protein